MDIPGITQDQLPDIRVSFPGDRRVDAHMGSRTIRTDQSVPHGGDDTAPEPFELFLASLATCAGYYVLGFCNTRGIPVDGIELIQHHQLDELTNRLIRVDITLQLPPTFPERYRSAVLQAAAACKVKRLLMAPPEVVVRIQPAAVSAVAVGPGPFAVPVPFFRP
jgi:putative redox protein